MKTDGTTEKSTNAPKQGDGQKDSAKLREAKLEKTLRANAVNNLKVHGQECTMTQELAWGLRVIDSDVERLRRRRNPLLGLFEQEGQLVLFLFAVFFVLLAVLAFSKTFRTIRDESYRQTKVLLRVANADERPDDSYPACADAYTGPWKQLTDPAAIARIFGITRKRTSRFPIYAYTRVVLVERETDQWLPEVEDCPPSLLLLSGPLK